MFGAPISESQGLLLSGVDKAADYMRLGGLQKVIEQEGWILEDMGNLPLKEIISQCQRSSEVANYKETTNVHQCFELGRALEKIYDASYQAARRGAFVLNVGGDRSVASPSIAGIMKARQELCVVWVGAHGSCNTPETLSSGHYHGMPAAHVLGWLKRPLPGFEWLKNFVPEHRFCYIGLRDIDESEAFLLRSSGVQIYSMYDIDKLGIGRVMDMALHRINPHKNRPIHLSFDIGAIDPSVAPGARAKARGGLTYREARSLCEMVAKTNMLGSMNIVEMDVNLDKPLAERLHGDNERQTVQLANELVACCIGKCLL